LASEFPFANAIRQGKAVGILGTIQRTNQSNAVVARRDRGIDAAADLLGKKIGLAPNSNSDYLLSVILAEAGIADDAVLRVPLEPNRIEDALGQGLVDAIATWQPHVANAQTRFADGATVVLRASAYTEFTVVGVRPQTLVDKRDAVQRLVNALVLSEDFVSAHGSEALQLVRDHFAGHQDVSLGQTWPQRKFQVRIDNVLLTALNNEGAWLAKRANDADLGKSPAPSVPDYRAAIASQFLEAIRPQSVTVLDAGGS
jgi:NitT/TauT family transport system substrate-binding protein